MVNPGRANEVVEQAIGRLIPLLNPFWGMLPRRLWASTKDFFVYTANFITADGTQLPLSGSRDVQTQIQNDSHFIIMAGVRTVFNTDDTTAIANPPITVQIQDSGSGRSLLSSFTQIENLFGTAQLPAYWPYPKIIKRSSTLTTQLVNLAATARHVRIAYLGFKVWPDRTMPESEF